MTKRKAIEGICTECKEWTSTDDTCCGTSVYAEGGYHSPDDEEKEDEENDNEEKKETKSFGEFLKQEFGKRYDQDFWRSFFRHNQPWQFKRSKSSGNE